jgi:hypothetical protein
VHGERAGDGRGHHTQGARHRDTSSLSRDYGREEDF